MEEIETFKKGVFKGKEFEVRQKPEDGAGLMKQVQESEETSSVVMESAEAGAEVGLLEVGEVRVDGGPVDPPGLVSRRRWADEIISDDDGGVDEGEAAESAEVVRRGASARGGLARADDVREASGERQRVPGGDGPRARMKATGRHLGEGSLRNLWADLAMSDSGGDGDSSEVLQEEEAYIRR